MARVPPSLLARFGRASRSGAGIVRPAVPFILGTGAVALGTGFVIREATGFRNAGSPPLQLEDLDTDPSTPGAETMLAFDRKTGRTLIFGEPPVDKVGPERSQERELTNLIWVGGAVVALVLVVFATKGGK